MLDVLGQRAFRHLFLAQIAALLGTGLATVGLGLMAYQLAGERASAVLATVFTIKMVAYVGIAPVAGALAERLDRRRLLVLLDLVRAAVALSLPWVTATWQVYGLIFVLQAASAMFTPAFQATVPDLLPDEARYTRALSLSRLAYDLENIVSPALAALLLLLFTAGALFVGTGIGFLVSALLVASVRLPGPGPVSGRRFLDRTTAGVRRYLATPRLRGLLLLNLAVAASAAMVLVNSVLVVRGRLGLPESALAWTLFAFGAGSMLAALILPRVLERLPDRPVMLSGAVLVALTPLGLAIQIGWAGLDWTGLLFAWFLIGLGYSTVLTPSGRLLRRSADPADRPLLFAAQFALSHACWLLTYPLSGWLMTRFGLITTLTVLAALAAAATLAAVPVWPGRERDPPS